MGVEAECGPGAWAHQLARLIDRASLTRRVDRVPAPGHGRAAGQRRWQGYRQRQGRSERFEHGGEQEGEARLRNPEQVRWSLFFVCFVFGNELYGVDTTKTGKGGKLRGE